jgi:hypothetical protein
MTAVVKQVTVTAGCRSAREPSLYVLPGHVISFIRSGRMAISEAR